MKSGLEDRNNLAVLGVYGIVAGVSMKSGLEDRNNLGLNVWTGQVVCVSMKSGLEDRNNGRPGRGARASGQSQ